MRWTTRLTSSYLPLAQNDYNASRESIELSSPPMRFKSGPRYSLRAIAVVAVVISVSTTIYFLDLIPSFSPSSSTAAVEDVASQYSGASILDSPPGTPNGWYYYSHERTQASPRVDVSAPRRYIRTRGQRIFSDDQCAEQWIARGTVCDGLADAHTTATAAGDDGRIDVIWTWINGSDPFLADLRTVASAEDSTEIAQHKGDKEEEEEHNDEEKEKEGDVKPVAGSSEHHFRDHDELRFSMRSVYQNVPTSLIRKLYLFTSSLPYTTTNDTVDQEGLRRQGRMGHVPTWLDLTKNAQPPVALLHHWENFRVTDSVLESLGFPVGDEGARQWRDKYLPTFNSLTIESQFPHIEEFKDTLLYLNDDYFIMRPLNAGDFATFLYGPVFRIQRSWPIGHITTDGWYNYKSDMEGEQPTLEHANWYLNDRFGGRRRSYIRHVARSMDVTVMRELNTVWPDVLATTASSRFRAHTPQVHLAFMQMYYHIEKHREALLYSFIVLRADQDQDGRLTPKEAQALRDDLTGVKDTKHGSLSIMNPHRKNQYVENFKKAGLESPAETSYIFPSGNGYPFVHKHPDDGSEWPTYTAKGRTCVMKADVCWPEGFGQRDISTQDLFRQWMFLDISCGDCAIVALLGQSGDAGLEAFLPRKRDDDVAVSMDEYDIVGGSVAHWWEGIFTPTRAVLKNPRAYAIRNIQRYSYVIGDTPMEWLQVKDTSVSWKLDELKDTDGPCALLAINDDVADGAEMEPTDRLLKEWYRARWEKVRGWWERSSGDAEDPNGLFDGWWTRRKTRTLH